MHPANLDLDADRVVLIDYTNYRGERDVRRVIPHSIKFGSNEWHREPQWILIATDVARNVMREFAMKDIHKWVPAQSSTSSDSPSTPTGG